MLCSLDIQQCTNSLHPWCLAVWICNNAQCTMVRGVNLHTCVSVRVCTMYVCMCLNLYAYVFMYMCMYVSSVCVFLYMYVNVYVWICM